MDTTPGCPQQNTPMEAAKIKELSEMQRQARKALWQKATKDPLLWKDIKDVASAFGAADAETARRIG